MPVSAGFLTLWTVDSETSQITEVAAVQERELDYKGTGNEVAAIELYIFGEYDEVSDTYALASGDTVNLIVQTTAYGNEGGDVNFTTGAIYEGRSLDYQSILITTDTQTYLLSIDDTIYDGYVVGTDIPIVAENFLCFAAGTQIATPTGEVAVETLAPGDLVLTAEGASVAVKFLGKTTRSKVFTPAEILAPVRISAGALGENLPHTDLEVTVDHALALEGALVHAGALVNGTTITRVPLAELADRVTYYHVEIEEHCLLLANGAEAESYVDNTSRETLDNYADYVALYGAEQTKMAELDMPRAKSFRQVPLRVRDLIAARAAALAESLDLAS